MDQRQERVKRLFQLALERDPHRRSEFLEEACDDDPSVQAEVESLLSSHEEDVSSRDSSPTSLTSARPTESQSTLVGHTVSHYQILDRLGSGGMGDVYLANDTKLSRKVALKVLPPGLAASKELRARFEREAKAVAALNHPGIVHVYSIEEADGVHFITLELVQGKTLSALISRPGLPLKELLEIAIEMADAVSAAHAAGVIHRDLKPHNVMISDEGRVKILDFGLAKLRPEPGGAVESKLPTLSTTHAGRIMGTVAYMSPEQAEGKPVDARTDIFSLGIVLYEMATSERPFKGDSTASILSSILRDTPASATDVNPRVPALLARIIRRCLSKDPERRFQTARDLRIELEELKLDVDSGSLVDAGFVSDVPRKATAKLPVTVLVATILTIRTTLWIFRRAPTRPGEVPQPTHTQITFTGDASLPAISPDGAFAAYVTGDVRRGQKIIVHDLLGKQSLEVYEGKFLDSPLRWSPDGARLVFSGGDVEGGTYIVSRLGGAARRLPMFASVSWSPDGTQLAGVLMGWRRIDLTEVVTGESTSIALSGAFYFLTDVDWSPRNDRLLFLTEGGDAQSTIWMIATDGTRQVKVVEAIAEVSSPRWSPTGDAIYYLQTRDQTRELWRVAISGEAGRPDTPSLVLSGLQAGGYFTVTEDGRGMLYTREASSSNLVLATVESARWRTEPQTTGTLFHSQPSVSPDGTRVAFSRGDGQTSNILAMPIVGGPTQQLTYFDSRNTSPVWSPDGSRIAFASTEGGTARVWSVGTQQGSPRPFLETEVSLNSMALEWWPRQSILYQKPGNRNFGVLDPVSGNEGLLIEDETVGWAFSPRSAPDGRRVALMWNHDEVRGLWILSPDEQYSLSGELRNATVTQSLDATDHRGKELRLRAHVKTNVTPPSRAQLSLSVERADGEMYSFSTRERPIQSKEWETYELGGDVAEDAVSVTFGGLLFGEGGAWFDNVELTVRAEGDDWVQVAIANPGFETTGGEGWRTTRGQLGAQGSFFVAGAPGFSYRLVREDPYEGNSALLIEGSQSGLAAGVLSPVGWSSDSTWIYAVDEDTEMIVKIPVTGGEAIPVSSALDPGQSLWSAAVAPDGARFVLEVNETRSDVWLVENFDPGVR